LTDLETLRILLERNQEVRGEGNIRAKGKCPICGEKFVEIPGVAYICPKDKTAPKKLYVDLPWKGQRIRIFSDKTGQVLDSYSRANTALKGVNWEIQNHTFDPQRYVKAEASKFWAVNLLERFENDRVPSIAPSAKADYKRQIRIAKEFFGNQDVRDIRKLDIINYKDHCDKAHKWAPKTLKGVLDLFRTFLRYVMNDLELIDKVPPFPEVVVPEPGFRWVAQKDQVSLFEKVPEAHRPIIAFLMLHGCRPGEGRALKCKDINVERGSITISATFSKNVYREKRKGRRAKPIIIPIHPELYGYLADRVKTSLPEAFVFINPQTGRCYYEKKLRKIWSQVRDDAKIGKELRLYDASRHSFASQLVNSGVSLFTVSKLLGHSSTKMTERYSHANLDSLRAELSKISLQKQVVTLVKDKKDEQKS
jgi:integrase